MRAAFLLLLCIAMPAVAAIGENGWNEGLESGGDPIVGIVIAALVYGVLKLIASGEFFGVLRSVAGGILLIYAPVLTAVVCIWAVSLLTRAVGYSAEEAGWFNLLAGLGAAWWLFSRTFLRPAKPQDKAEKI